MEPPPILLWLRITNADAEDYPRVGMLIDILDKETDPAFKRVFVVDFGDGEIPGAFWPDEVERIYAS